MIEEINTTSLHNLYYANNKLSALKGKKPKKIITGKDFKGKPLKCKEGDKKCLAKMTATIKCKKGDKKCLANKKKIEKICKYGDKKCVEHVIYPYGRGYLRASKKNVHIISINFYVRLLKLIGDQREYAVLSKLVSHKCGNMNIFAPLRQSVLNCRAIGRRIKKDKNVQHTFYMGCMANILRVVKNKCPNAFVKSNSLRNLGAAISKLTHVDKRFKHRLSIDANIFVKKLSFFLRVFSGLIQKRLDVMNKLRAIAAKKAAIKRAKDAKAAKILKARMLKINKAKKICYAKAKKAGGGGKFPLTEAKIRKKCDAIGRQKKKKIIKKKVKKPKKKPLICKQKCKKGFACKKVCKRELVGKFVLKKNTPKQDKFVKLIRLTAFKGQTIAALFGKWIMQVAQT